MSDRLCYDCKHFEIQDDRGWSEYTPGSGFSMFCFRQKWDDPRENISRVELRRRLVMARTCDAFEAAEHGE